MVLYLLKMNLQWLMIKIVWFVCRQNWGENEESGNFVQMIAEREYRFWIIIFHNWSNHKSNFFLLLSEPPCKFLPEFAIISAWMHLFANFWGKTNLQDLILRSGISGRQWLNNRELHPIILKYQHLLLQTKWSVALRRGELTTGCCLGLREAIQQSQN